MDIPVARCPNIRLEVPVRVVHCVVLVLTLSGCAGAQNARNDLEEGNEAFSKSIRWSDLRGIVQRVVPERQKDFLRVANGAEENLKVTDYELEDVQVGGDKAVVHSRVSWYREPSIVAKTEWMTILWVRKGTTWLIASIAGGPLPLPPR
ncbi:MAG TPA: hypothetical protein VGH20_09490 [Myxococcales bacterium]